MMVLLFSHTNRSPSERVHVFINAAIAIEVVNILSSARFLQNEIEDLTHECPWFNEFIKQDEEKKIKCEACQAFYHFVATSLIKDFLWWLCRCL